MRICIAAGDISGARLTTKWTGWFKMGARRFEAGVQWTKRSAKFRHAHDGFRQGSGRTEVGRNVLDKDVGRYANAIPESWYYLSIYLPQTSDACLQTTQRSIQTWMGMEKRTSAGRVSTVGVSPVLTHKLRPSLPPTHGIALFCAQFAG